MAAFSATLSHIDLDRVIPITAIERAIIGAELLVAGHVWLLGYRVAAMI